MSIVLASLFEPLRSGRYWMWWSASHSYVAAM